MCHNGEYLCESSRWHNSCSTHTPGVSRKNRRQGKQGSCGLYIAFQFQDRSTLYAFILTLYLRACLKECNTANMQNDKVQNLKLYTETSNYRLCGDHISEHPQTAADSTPAHVDELQSNGSLCLIFISVTVSEAWHRLSPLFLLVKKASLLAQI